MKKQKVLWFQTTRIADEVTCFTPLGAEKRKQPDELFSFGLKFILSVTNSEQPGTNINFRPEEE